MGRVHVRDCTGTDARMSEVRTNSKLPGRFITSHRIQSSEFSSHLTRERQDKAVNASLALARYSVSKSGNSVTREKRDQKEETSFELSPSCWVKSRLMKAGASCPRVHIWPSLATRHLGDASIVAGLLPIDSVGKPVDFPELSRPGHDGGLPNFVMWNATFGFRREDVRHPYI